MNTVIWLNLSYNLWVMWWLQKLDNEWISWFMFFSPSCPAVSHYHTFLTCVSWSHPLPQAFNPSLIFPSLRDAAVTAVVCPCYFSVLAIFRVLTALVRWFGFAPFWIHYLYLTPNHISVWSCFGFSPFHFWSLWVSRVESLHLFNTPGWNWLDLASNVLSFFLCLLAVCVRTSTDTQREIIHLTKYLGVSLGSHSVRKEHLRKSKNVKSGSWNRSQQHDWFALFVILYNSTSNCIAPNPVSMQLFNWMILVYWMEGGGGVTEGAVYLASEPILNKCTSLSSWCNCKMSWVEMWFCSFSEHHLSNLSHIRLITTTSEWIQHSP